MRSWRGSSKSALPVGTVGGWAAACPPQRGATKSRGRFWGAVIFRVRAAWCAWAVAVCDKPAITLFSVSGVVNNVIHHEDVSFSVIFCSNFTKKV